MTFSNVSSDFPCVLRNPIKETILNTQKIVDLHNAIGTMPPQEMQRRGEQLTRLEKVFFSKLYPQDAKIIGKIPGKITILETVLLNAFSQRKMDPKKERQCIHSLTDQERWDCILYFSAKKKPSKRGRFLQCVKQIDSCKLSPEDKLEHLRKSRGIPKEIAHYLFERVSSPREREQKVKELHYWITHFIGGHDAIDRIRSKNFENLERSLFYLHTEYYIPAKHCIAQLFAEDRWTLTQYEMTYHSSLPAALKEGFKSIDGLPITTEEKLERMRRLIYASVEMQKAALSTPALKTLFGLPSIRPALEEHKEALHEEGGLFEL